MLITSQVQTRKTLDQLFNELAGNVFYIVTQRKVVTVEEARMFVDQARAKSLNDFNIAQLLQVNNKPLVSML